MGVYDGFEKNYFARFAKHARGLERGYIASGAAESTHAESDAITGNLKKVGGGARRADQVAAKLQAIHSFPMTKETAEEREARNEQESQREALRGSGAEDMHPTEMLDGDREFYDSQVGISFGDPDQIPWTEEDERSYTEQLRTAKPK